MAHDEGRSLRSTLATTSVALALLSSCATVEEIDATRAHNSVAAGRAYRVRVHRPLSVGARFRIEARGESRRRVETLDRFRRRTRSEEESTRVEFIGDATVRAVDDQGYARALSIVVQRAFADDGERNGPFFSAGATLVIDRTRRAEQPRVELDGSEIDRFSYNDLSLALDLENLHGYHEELFGEPARRRVGERWSVPVGRVLREQSATLNALGEEFSAWSPAVGDDDRDDRSERAPSAEATLARVFSIDGVSCLELRSSFQLSFRTHAPGRERTTRTTQTHEWTALVPRARRRMTMGMASRDTVESWVTVRVDGGRERTHLIGERSRVVRFAAIE